MLKLSKAYRQSFFYLGMMLCALAGFMFRLQGIMGNHSLWADEAYIAYISREILHGKLTFAESYSLIAYQPLQVLIGLTSMAVLGTSEFALRLPIVIAGSIGIIIAFLIAHKLSDGWGGILASFLYAFSQLNLANSTQFKSYTVIQTLLLIGIYLLIMLESKRSHKLVIHLLIIVMNIAATLLHFLGVLNWLPYLVYCTLSYRYLGRRIIRYPYLLWGMVIFIVLIIYILQLSKMVIWFLHAGPGNILFTFNHITYLRELLWKQYGFITLPAIFGLLVTIRSQRKIMTGTLIFITATIYLWSFKHYTHNIRYLVPLFGVLFVYFGVFWSLVGKELLKNSAVTVSIVLLMLFLGGYKISRKPLVYYSPNADLIADVQNANYKEAFSQLKQKFPDYQEYTILNDLIDAQLWYLDGYKPAALFMKHDTIGLKYGEETVQTTTKITIYTSLEQFIHIMEQTPKGLLIVEDWHSFLPEEIKQYAKKNLKREIRVEGLPQAGGDNWPLEIYSWGI